MYVLNPYACIFKLSGYINNQPKIPLYLCPSKYSLILYVRFFVLIFLTIRGQRVRERIKKNVAEYKISLMGKSSMIKRPFSTISSLLLA